MEKPQLPQTAPQFGPRVRLLRRVRILGSVRGHQGILGGGRAGVTLGVGRGGGRRAAAEPFLDVPTSVLYPLGSTSPAFPMVGN